MRTQRFERHRSPSSLVVVARPQPGDDTVEVAIDRTFVADESFETIHPEPERVTAAADEFIYEFAVEEGEREVHLSFETLPEGIGPRSFWVRIIDGPLLRFRQFVFP